MKRLRLAETGGVTRIESHTDGAMEQKLEQLPGLGSHHSLVTILHVQFTINAACLGLDRVDRNDQRSGYLRIREASRKPAQNLALAVS